MPGLLMRQAEIPHHVGKCRANQRHKRHPKGRLKRPNHARTLHDRFHKSRGQAEHCRHRHAIGRYSKRIIFCGETFHKNRVEAPQNHAGHRTEKAPQIHIVAGAAHDHRRAANGYGDHDHLAGRDFFPQHKIGEHQHENRAQAVQQAGKAGIGKARAEREQCVGSKISHAAHQQKTRPVRPLRLQKTTLDGGGDQHRSTDGKAKEKQPQHRHIAKDHAVAHIQAAPQGHHHKQ